MLIYPYPRCVLPQVAAFVLDSVGVPKLLKELHLFNDVLPFLKHKQSDEKQELHREHRTKTLFKRCSFLREMCKYFITDISLMIKLLHPNKL